MTRRNRIILIVVGLLVIAVILFLAIWTRPDEEKKVEEEPDVAANVNVGVEPAVEEKIETRQATPEELAKAEIETLSAHFAERFGSYSNDGNFENIVDLYPFMTSLMKNWAEEYVEILRAEVQKETYEGATTRAVSVQLTSLNLDVGSAETVVKTQKTEVKMIDGAPSERVYYQDLRLEFLKLGAEWKVNGAYWMRD